MNPGNRYIRHREKPRKLDLLEEVLHHAQSMIPDFEENFPYPWYELHVKDFMIRHRKLFNLSYEDIKILQQMMKIQMRSKVDVKGNNIALPASANYWIANLFSSTGKEHFLDMSVDDISQIMTDDIKNGLMWRGSLRTLLGRILF